MSRPTVRLALPLAFCAAGLAVTAGCKSTPPPAAVFAVTLTPAGLVPATLTAQAGDSITWTNQDTLAHGLISDDSITFGTTREMAQNGGRYGFRFAVPGTYGYHWTTATKPGALAARGTVVVGSTASAAPTSPR